MTLRDRERVLERIRPVARACGYAIAVHGSETRDLDVIAVPWTDSAGSASELVDHVCAEGGFVLRDSDEPQRRPHGRVGYVLHGASGFAYVDLSILPRSEAS